MSTASDKTKQKYQRIISNMFKAFTGTKMSDPKETKAYVKDLSQFTRTKAFLKWIEKKYTNIGTRVNYISILKSELVAKTRYKKAIAVYQKYFDGIHKIQETEMKSQTIKEGSNKKVADLKMLQSKVRAYKGSIFSKTLCALYVFFPTRRNTDYRVFKKTKSLQAAKADEGFNHIFMDKKGDLNMLFQQYKTFKTYGTQIFKVKNSFLKKTLIEYLSNLDYGDVLFANRKGEHYSTGGFSNRFKKLTIDVFGQSFKVNDIRRSFISTKLKLNLNQNQKETLSEYMASNFLVNYNKLTDDVDSLFDGEIF